MTQAVQDIQFRATRAGAASVRGAALPLPSDFALFSEAPAPVLHQPQEVMALLAQACPSFAPEWLEHQRAHGHALLYIAASAFAHHLLSLCKAGDASCFEAVAACLERAFRDGSQAVREFATIGVLEGVQNVWSSDGADADHFRRHLGSEGQRWWQSLTDFWSGKVPYVGYAA